MTPFVRTFTWLPLFLFAHMACDSDGALPPSGSGGAHVATGGRLGASGGSVGAGEGGGSSGASSDGGTGASSSGGSGGKDDPGQGGRTDGASGAAGDASARSGGAGGAGGLGGAGGEAGAPEQYVNGCSSFVDRTATAAQRSQVWDENLRSTGERCMMIRVGQSVSFVGDFDQHPLLPLGGDEPNPVAASAVYDVPGTYGYYCPTHPSDMNGAIRVVP